jgi:hypothetical protein
MNGRVYKPHPSSFVQMRGYCPIKMGEVARFSRVRQSGGSFDWEFKHLIYSNIEWEIDIAAIFLESITSPPRVSDAPVISFALKRGSITEFLPADPEET